MGISTSKKKTTTDQTQNESSTVTPTNPQWTTDAIQGFVGKIDAWGAKDPSEMIAGPSGLQTQAWERAGALGGNYDEAIGLARKAGAAGPNLAGGNYGYMPGRLGVPMKADVGGYDPTKAAFRGYDAVRADAYGYDPTAESRTVIGHYQTGKASQVGGFRGYDPALMDRTVIDPIERVNARTGASFMGAYKDPYMKDVVDTTLGDFDENAGQLRARQAAQAAGNKAFGGSRYAIQEAQTEGELARGRASTAAKLRSDGFNMAAGLGMADANRFLSADTTNAGNWLQRSLAQAGMDQSRLGYNADAMTGARRYMSDWDNQGIMKNADLGQEMEEFNVGNFNRRQDGQASLDAGLNQRSADRGTAASEYLSSQNNRVSSDFARDRTAANAYAADRFNDVESRFASDRTQAGRDLATWQNGANERFADRSNERTAAQWGADTDAARYGAERAWDLEQFNVGQQDEALARQMQSAQIISQIMQQYGVDERAAIQLMASLGEQERGIDQQKRMAELAQLEAIGSLYGATPFQLFQGQRGTGTTTMRGTTMERGTPSLFNSMLAAASVISQFKPSERHLKMGIIKVGALPNGLNVYRYRYVWDADDVPLHTGVMVDEVEQIQPEALGPIVNGIQTVDYSKVEGWVQ